MSQTKAQLINAVDGSIVDADIVGLTSSKLSGALPAISGASLTNLPSGGITQSDQWRITSTFITNSSDITSNWERVDTGGFGLIGSGMTQSSGIFTFPATGIYRIDLQVVAYRGTAQNIRFVNGYVKTTTDNSSYTEDSAATSSISNDTNAYAALYLSHQFDVTNVSTHKVKFFVQAEDDLLWVGQTSLTQTGATFTRLGDT